MNDKRNASVIRGDGETVDSYAGRLNELISRIEWQSEGHRQWYTHKNPYGCWICEILQISRQLVDIMLVDRESLNYNEELDLVDDEDL